MEEPKKPVDPGHDEGHDGSSKDGRSRTWMLLLYPDNEGMLEVLTSRLPELDWDYAGRIHDQEGKPHHHVVVLFKDGRKAADVAKDLGLETRWLRAWDRKKKAFRYLCHRDNPEKYQYDTDGIYGTLAEQAVKACGQENKDEAAEVALICDMIAGYDGIVSYDLVLRMLSSCGLYATFRRMGVIAVRLIEEHNNRYMPRKDGY